MLLKNGTILNKEFRFEKADVAINGIKIAENPYGNEVIDCTGCYIVPGLGDAGDRIFGTK